MVENSDTLDRGTPCYHQVDMIVCARRRGLPRPYNRKCFARHDDGGGGYGGVSSLRIATIFTCQKLKILQRYTVCVVL